MKTILLDDENTMDNVYICFFCLVLIDYTKSYELENLHMAAFFFKTILSL